MNGVPKMMNSAIRFLALELIGGKCNGIYAKEKCYMRFM
jgi:hypothetical protein